MPLKVKIKSLVSEVWSQDQKNSRKVVEPLLITILN
jgi:hypothetical protein